MTKEEKRLYDIEYRKTYVKPSRKKGAPKRERKKCVSCTKEWLEEYNKKNKDRIRQRINQWYNKRRKEDPLFRLKLNIRRRLRQKLVKKSQTTCEIIGCSYLELSKYLEARFENWMTWENYGKYNGLPMSGWDLDHIIPLSSAKNDEEVKKLNHYTNLQPLCSSYNRTIKRNNIHGY